MKNRFLSLLLVMGLLGLAGTAQAESIWQTSAYGFPVSSHGSFLYNTVWVNFGVWPVAAGHSAGSVYTSDGWNHTSWATGSWSHNSPNNYGSYDENWTVSLYSSGNGTTCRDSTFWYALYVDNSAGQRFWNNNNGWNYEYRVYCR